MKALIDKLLPGSLSDIMIWVVAIGGVIVLLILVEDIGKLALTPLLALFGQKNNAKRKSQQAEGRARELEAQDALLIAESEASSRKETNITEEMTRIAESEVDITPINKVVADAKEDWS